MSFSKPICQTLTYVVFLHVDPKNNKFILAGGFFQHINTEDVRSVRVIETTVEKMQEMSAIITDHGGYNLNAYAGKFRMTRDGLQLCNILVDSDDSMIFDERSRDYIPQSQPYFVLSLPKSTRVNLNQITHVFDFNDKSNLNQTFNIHLLICNRFVNPMTHVMEKIPFNKFESFRDRSAVAILQELCIYCELPLVQNNKLKVEEFMTLAHIPSSMIDKPIDEWTLFDRANAVIKQGRQVGTKLVADEIKPRPNSGDFPALGSDSVAAKSIDEQIKFIDARLSESQKKSDELKKQLDNESAKRKKLEEERVSLLEQKRKEEEEKKRKEAEKKRKEEVENKLMDEAKQQFLENGTISFNVLKQLTHEKKEELMTWCEQNSSDKNSDETNDA